MQSGSPLRRYTRRALRIFLVACVLSVQGCGKKALGVLFDLPQDEQEEQAASQQGGSGNAIPMIGQIPGYLLQPEDTVTPELELTLDPDTVIARLPRDHAGNVDWVQAWRTEVIRPRNGKEGPRSRPPNAFEFKFDFYFPGPSEMFDAYFPHSVHVEQIDCAQCHPRIFRSRGTVIKMADVLTGKYCGECHGKVAFNPTTACERCHTGMTMPPDRSQPALIGTVMMKRATEILAADDSLATVDGNAAGVRTDAFPRAQFPHWVHRIRFQCRTCHMEIFEPRAGSNAITMADIDEGKFCGECHNSQIAFSPSMTNCARCHPVEPAAAASLQPPPS